MNLGKEMVDEKRVVVKHIRGEDMIADGFSKPYDPAEHKKFKNKQRVGVERSGRQRPRRDPSEEPEWNPAGCQARICSGKAKREEK